ncbi:MAG: hypothetical protein R3F31_06510 [Verrucomicrobiales bacterium]
MELDALRTALAASPDNVPLLLLVANACIDQFSSMRPRTTMKGSSRSIPASPRPAPELPMS